MRILVTGGGGFAGRHLLRRLLADGGHEIFATGLEPLPEFDEGDPLAGIEWISMDLGSTESIEAGVTRAAPEQVYHLAGQASSGRSFAMPLETWEINATGTLRLMTVLAAADVAARVVLVSSAEVYGDVPARLHPLAETAPVQPATPYGASKAAAELAALTMGTVHGIRVVVARSFNHIGPGQDERFVLPSIALQLTRIANGSQKPVVEVGNLEVIRDFLDVRDVVAAYVLLMEEGVDGGVYNIASGTAYPLLSVIERLVELSGTGARLEVDRSRIRPVDIAYLTGDPSRLRELGWFAKATLDDSLQDLLAEAAARA